MPKIEAWIVNCQIVFNFHDLSAIKIGGKEEREREKEVSQCLYLCGM